MKHYNIPNIENIPNTIVLVNGEFPKNKFALSTIDKWINGSGTLICCDGAINKLQKYTSKFPDIIIGDLDSIDKKLKNKLSDRIIHIASQDTNDLTKAMNYTTGSLKKNKITILGISGGREDHFIANIALLPSYRNIVDELIVITDTGYIRLIEKGDCVESPKGQQVSIFNFKHTAVSANNLKWPLNNLVLTELWCGSLNESMGGYIKFDCENTLVVYFLNTK